MKELVLLKINKVHKSLVKLTKKESNKIRNEKELEDKPK